MNNFDNKNAFIGQNVETLFKNSIGDYPKIIEKLGKLFKIEGRFLNAIKTGIHGDKADVKMEFACGHNINANIKAFKASSASFNQATRTSIKNFCERFDLGIQEELEKLFISKARDKNSLLFPPQEQSHFLSVFQEIAGDILKWAFLYKQSREILVIYERDESIMRIYSMKDVLKNLTHKVSFTKRVNIMIGGCVVLQRKGGNWVHSKDIPKDSLKHPGNNIQIKLKMKEFIDSMEECKIGGYVI